MSKQQLNMGFSAACRRRCVSIGFCRIFGGATDYFGFPPNHRMMSTVGATASERPSAPLLMQPPAVDGRGNIAYTFQSLAKKDTFLKLENKIGGGSGGPDELQLPPDSDLLRDVKFVGSSHGWIALHNLRNHDLFLSNPIAERHMKLPPLPSVDRLVLSSSPLESEEEDESCVAFKSGRDGRLGFCRPRRRSTTKWTAFGTDHVYDNLVFSRTHNRLFSVGSKSIFLEAYPRPVFNGLSNILESWDLGEIDGLPTRDGVIEDDIVVTNWVGSAPEWRSPEELKKQCYQLKYLVCAEDSGDLFLVVRHVNLRAGPGCSVVEKIVFSSYDGCNYVRTPYRTIDFDVYRVDWEGGELIYMEDSLLGLAIFVGISQPLAIPATDSAHLKPDSVYFTDENCLIGPTRLEPVTYGGHDNGVFDYRNKDFSFYNDISKIVPLPLWFTPNPNPPPPF